MIRKYTILAIFALIGCAIATKSDNQGVALVGDEDDEGYSSAIRLMPTDGIETGALEGHYKMFSDFCIKSRDEIKNFLSESANGAAAGVLDALFSEAGDFGQALINAQRSAVQEGVQIVRENAVAPARDEVAESKEEIKKDLEKSTENLTLLQYISAAVKVVIDAVIETAKTQVFQRLALMRSRMDGDSLKQMIEMSCQKVQFDLQNRLNRQFSSVKDQIRSASSRSPDKVAISEMLKKAKPETIGCVSTTRVGKVVKFCEIFKMAGPTIFPLLGM